MSETQSQNDFLELLLQLQTRCQDDPVLAKDWATAAETFPGDLTGDPHAKHRFREWFLLERPAEALGAPPAVAWAPESPEEDSLWHRLLDSYFGLFQGKGQDEQGYPILEDLWSGRRIRLHGERMALDEQGLLVGRVAVGGADHHIPMTGAAFLVAPGLGDALAEDLSRIRAEQPRARLSQQECENLLLPYLQGVGPGSEGTPTGEGSESSSTRTLKDILQGQGAWTERKVLALVEQEGVQEALNVLAFESELDLEALRHCLLDANPPEVPAAGRGPASDETLPTEHVQAALREFEAQREAGEDMASAFQALEEKLGLEPGTSDPYREFLGEDGAENEPVGRPELPGIPMLLATYLWEMEQAHSVPSRETVEAITAFLEFLEGLQERALDPEEVQQVHLLAFLCRERKPDDLKRTWNHLHSFLGWLQEEQGAPIQAHVETLEAAQQVVTVNHRLMAEDQEGESMTLLTTVDPIQVEAEDGESVPVDGWPVDLGFQPEVGDAVRGTWMRGRFHLASWLPKRLMPAPAEPKAKG